MIETIIIYLQNEKTLLFKWQTLIGALIGPVLAFLFSIFFSSVEKFRTEIKENIRRIEIGLTSVLNDIYEIREELKKFVLDIRRIITEAESFTDNNSYFLVWAVFPPIREVWFDNEIAILRSRSLYLHNKLLWIGGGIRNVNISVNEIRESYRVLIADNQRFSISKSMLPQQQREAYIQNLSSFANHIDGFLTYLEKGIEILVQAKVFNIKLKEKGFLRSLWIYEGVSFNYFENKKAIQVYTSIFEIQNRVDKRLKSETEKLINEAERRIRERDTRS